MSDAELLREIPHGLYLTASGYKALQSELEHLTMVKRPEIADRIRESLEHGEFSEDNSELDEVKFEQAMVESRVAELKGIFGTAHVLEEDMIPTDHVGIGSVVTLIDQEFQDEFKVRVVASIEADPDNDLISSESPMGLALLGNSAKEIVEVDAPSGRKRYQIKVISR